MGRLFRFALNKNCPTKLFFDINLAKHNSLHLQFNNYIIMLDSFFRKIVLIFIFSSAVAQTEVEIVPPYNIKTVTFIQSNENVIPIFKLGDGFQFQFDDLFGNEANYYYEIIHCDYNWKHSDIPNLNI